MKQYSQLTQLGKIRRMHKVACQALESYDINVKRVSYLAEETNMFFKVSDISGQKYALKICQEESSKIDDNLAEVFLIGEVAANSDITVPEVVAGKYKESVTLAGKRIDGFDKRVIVYKWMEGKEIDGREDDEYFFKLGSLAAKLHLATENTNIPPGISPKKWDKVFYYRDEMPVYKQDEYKNILTLEYHETMDFMIPYLDDRLSEFYKKSQPQLIHADLNPYNVWVYKDELRLIDFEEAMFALPVHDLAIALFYYRYDPKFDYGKVRELIFKGYKAVAPLPGFTVFDTELLMIARRVNFLNYVLLLSDDPSEYIKTNIQRVKDFIKEYV